MKILLSLFLLFGMSSAAIADFNCKDLAGMWSSERFDNTLSSERRTIKAMNSDGSYWIKFIHDNGEEITIQEETGKWSCAGNILSIKITSIDDKQVQFFNNYQLVNPTRSFHSLKPVDPNCAIVIGDCSSELLLEYFRVLN